MKLLMKRAFTVVLAAVLLFGCGEDNNKTGGNELTPQENKAKLEQCAMEVLGKINPQDHKTLVETIDAFAYKADYGWFEDEIGPTPGEGIEPNPMGMMSVIRKAVTTYNPVVLSVLATEVDYIAIPTGIYTFDEVARSSNLCLKSKVSSRPSRYEKAEKKHKYKPTKILSSLFLNM